MFLLTNKMTYVHTGATLLSDTCLPADLYYLMLHPGQTVSPVCKQRGSTAFLIGVPIMQALAVLLVSVAEPVRVTSRSTKVGSFVSDTAVEQQQLLTNGAEYAFSLAAFFDGRRNLVRIFAEIEPKFVTPIATGELQLPHVSQCSFTAANGTTWSTPTLHVDTQWAYGDDERIRTVNRVSPIADI